MNPVLTFTMTRLGAFEYYFRPKLDRRSDGFGLNVAVCPPNEVHPVHEHSNPGIVVVLSGEYIEEFDGREIVLPPLTARFRPAGAIHSHRVGPAGATALHLEFTDEWLDGSGCDVRSLRNFTVADKEQVGKCSIKTLIAIAGSSGPDWQDAGLAIAEQIVATGRAEPREPVWLKRAKAYVDEQYTSQIRLGQIAREVGISKMHLASTFRNHYGCTVTEYVTRRRLEFAATMILDGWPVGRAGVEAGFFDHAYFTKTFKAAFSDRPSLLIQFERSRLEEQCDSTSHS